MNQISHSYTSLKEFQQCPRKYYENRVLKLHPFVETEAVKWGNYVHKCLEDYIKDGVPLPENVSMYQAVADSAKRKGIARYVEHAQGIDAEGNVVGFWGKGGVKPWFRGKADVLIRTKDTAALTLDWKTGTNIKYADRDQLELMALLAFCEFPELERVDGAIMFLPLDDMVRHTNTRDEVPRIMTKWKRVTDRIEFAHRSGVWQEKSGPLCGWCPSKECQHWYDGPARKAAKQRRQG